MWNLNLLNSFIWADKPTRSHKNIYLCALFVRHRFYVPYCTFRHSIKDKCPLSGAKTQVQGVHPGTFLLCWYRHVFLCFYYVASGTYCGGSEFKYLGTVAKSLCSIVLEICLTPNPTLNLPDSVNKCKTDIKTYLLMQFWTVLSNYSYTGFELELLASRILLRTQWATEQTYRLLGVAQTNRLVDFSALPWRFKLEVD